MLFFRQTLLSVCLILSCAASFAQPVAAADVLPAIDEDSGPSAAFNILLNDVPGAFPIDAATVDLVPATVAIDNSITIPGEGTFVVDASGLVIFTPELNFNGTSSISYTVQDTDMPPATSAEIGISITVNEVNDAPTITALPNQIIDENENTGALVLAITDVDDDIADLALSATSDDLTLIPIANISFGTVGADRTITVTPVGGLSGGPVEITVSVSDGVNTPASMSFNVTVNAVNDPPSIATLPNQTINEDESTGALTLTITDPDDDISDLTLTASSNNVTLIPTGNITFGTSGPNRTVTITPVLNQNGGPVLVTIFVSDGVNPQESMSFNVTVTPVNDAPSITALTDQIIDEGGTTGALTLGITDPDNAVGSLTLSAISDNQTIIPDGNITFGTSGPNRTITVVPVPGQNGGPVEITVSVSDGVNTPATMSFNVTVNAVNDPPTIGVVSNQVINEDGTTGALVLTISDPDDLVADLILSATSDDAAIIPNNVSNIVFGTSGPNRTITINPAANQNGGPVAITISVSDGVNPPVTTSFNVTVNAVNDAPTIATLADQVIAEGGTTGPLTLTIADVDNAIGSLALSAVSGNTTIIPTGNITFGTSGPNRTITVVPAANQSGGPVNIVVSVSDGVNPAATMNFDVTVTAVNDPPTIATLADQIILEDVSTGALTLSITDPDDAIGTLSLSATSGNTTLIPNANISFGTSGPNRTITVLPALNQNGGPVTITVSVSDGVNPAATMNFDVTITPVNDPPTIAALANQVIDEDGTTGALTLTLADPDNAINSLTLGASSGNTTIIPNANITFGTSGSDRTVTVVPAANQNGGPVTITVSVDDGVNPPVTRNFNVTVTAVNDPPTISALTDQIIAEDGTSGAITLSFADLDNAVGTLTFSATSDNQTIIPDGNIAFATSGSNKTITIVPAANQSGGPVSVTVSVTDGVNPAASMSFNVTVTGEDDVPTITTITNQVINEDVATGLLSFTVNDAETAAGDLVVTGTSDTQGLIPDANISIVGSGATRTVQVTPALNQSGAAVITLEVSDGVNTASTSFQVTVNTVNDIPTITAVADQTINEDAATTTLNFTIGDVETAAASLAVTRSSSNTALVPLANVILGGSGADRTVQVTPVANTSGTTVITLNVSDGVNTATTTFQVTVTAVNDLPTITAIVSQTINEDNSTAALSFTIGDSETAIASLTVSGSSSNATLVPTSGVVFSGTGATRTVTITPAADQYGVATVTLSVNDGTATVSTTFDLNVNPVNDIPVINGQTPVATDEETPLEITLAHLTVTDVDDAYPADFTLTVLSNPNYTFTGTVITPNANVNGNIVVRVRVNDGSANSNIYNLQVTVNAVNDPPVITAQTALTINEDNSLTILLTHLTIVDPDNTTGFTLAIGSGDDYSFSSTTITPEAHFFGTLTIPITVSDGTSSSTPFNLQVQVNPVNDKPQIVGQIPVSIGEVQPVTIALSQLSIFDPDDVFPTDFTLYVLGGPNYSASGNTVTPAANFSGTLQVRIFVSDGSLNSDFYDFQILVNSTNDAPVITGQQNLNTAEGQAITIEFDDLVVDDPDNPYPTGFTLTILPGSTYTFSGMTVTPNPNVNGLIEVSVKVNDGAVDSAPFPLKITINSVNDPPEITNQLPLTIAEDAFISLLIAYLQIDDPDSPLSGFTMSISPGTNYTVSSGNVITPSPNYHGTLSVPVTVNDGALDSPPYNVQIQVTPVNDAPIITSQNDLSTLEDQPITLKLADFAVTDVDNTFPTGFTLSISPLSGPNYTVSGTTVTPNANFSGTLGVNGVTVSDGAASSNAVNVEITVNSVNDAPTLDPINTVTIQEDPADATVIPLANITPGPNENSQTVVVTAVTNHADWFETFEVVYSSGTAGSLRIKPKPNVNGTAQVTVRIQDNGVGTPAPNVNFLERSFAFEINPVNDPPTITSTAVTLAEAGQLYEYPVVAIDIEEEDITLTAPLLPAWLTLTGSANGTATLSGTPPVGTTGEVAVIIEATDESGASTDQEFFIRVNTRPIVVDFPLTTAEEVAHTFSAEFQGHYSDPDGNPIVEIQITQLPGKGRLTLNGNLVTLNSTIPAAEISNIKYEPLRDSVGTDIIKWNASDGLYYGIAAANILITISPVNDPPEVIAIEPPESDTLKYELGSEIPIKLTTMFDARDVDGDNIIAAEVGFFNALDYRPKQDVFVFKDTLGIVGNFNENLGILTLTGTAPVKDYVAAIRTIRYNYVDATNFELANRKVYVKLSDGIFGQTKERLVGLIYNFLELDIANAFTPNGANPHWNIYSPTGLGRYKDALIRVYNKRGLVVYEATGFDNLWNGYGPNGDALPPDSYYYTIDLKYDKKRYKGVVTILR